MSTILTFVKSIVSKKMCKAVKKEAFLLLIFLEVA